jgi:hypothetical protein
MEQMNNYLEKNDGYMYKNQKISKYKNSTK